jgi:hypothetical protein
MPFIKLQFIPFIIWICKGVYRLIKCVVCIYLVLFQWSEVLDIKAWAMIMMLKGEWYPSDGDTKLNLITKKLTIKDNIMLIDAWALICASLIWGGSNQFRQIELYRPYMCLFLYCIWSLIGMIATGFLYLISFVYIFLPGYRVACIYHCVDKYGHSYVQLLESRHQHVKALNVQTS